MYEPVNTPLIDDEDDEMTNEPVRYASSSSMVYGGNFPQSIAEQSVS
jgi:hypothetical protein